MGMMLVKTRETKLDLFSPEASAALDWKESFESEPEKKKVTITAQSLSKVTQKKLFTLY